VGGVARFNFMREAQIWYNRNPEQPPISSEFENVIVLSDDFLAHPIPNDLAAVKLLGGAPSRPGPLHVAELPLLQGEGSGVDSDLW